MLRRGFKIWICARTFAVMISFIVVTASFANAAGSGRHTHVRATTASVTTATIATAEATEESQDQEPKVYEPLWCPRNIFHLVQSLAESGIDVEPMRVLYIFGAPTESGDPLPIHPKASRTHGEEWSFHVVLEYQGLILDPDFTKSAMVVGTSDYFARMWRVGARSRRPQQEALFVRSIPALDYLQDYEGNWQWYLMQDPDPAVPAAEWLRSFDAAPDRMP